MVTNAIGKTQRKVEGHNFDIRKNLLEYDDVANDQLKVVYAQLDNLLDTDDVSETIADFPANKEGYRYQSLACCRSRYLQQTR